MHANLAAHGDHHRLAALRLVAFLEVGDQIGSHGGDTRLGADHLFQCRPAALEPRLLVFFLVLGQLVDVGVDLRQVFRLQRQLGQARLEVDRHRRAILPRLLHVVDVDVVAEHGARVAVFARYRGAGEGDEGGIGQRIAQVLGVAHLISRGRLSGHQCLPVIGGICCG